MILFYNKLREKIMNTNTLESLLEKEKQLKEELTENDSKILLADFGFTTQVPPDGLKTRCGTPAFVAPEIIIGKAYDTQVDMWSAGCLLYMLIGGYPPFQEGHVLSINAKTRICQNIIFFVTKIYV